MQKQDKRYVTKSKGKYDKKEKCVSHVGSIKWIRSLFSMIYQGNVSLLYKIQQV